MKRESLSDAGKIKKLLRLEHRSSKFHCLPLLREIKHQSLAYSVGRSWFCKYSPIWSLEQVSQVTLLSSNDIRTDPQKSIKLSDYIP